MSKVVIQWGYRQVVVSAEQAITIAEMLSDAEIYESKYHAKTELQPSYQTFHIFPMTETESISMRVITNEQYQMYRLAGRPHNE